MLPSKLNMLVRYQNKDSELDVWVWILVDSQLLIRELQLEDHIGVCVAGGGCRRAGKREASERLGPSMIYRWVEERSQ